MTQQYTITALLTPKTPPEPINSRTSTKQHIATHSAGIPEFNLVKKQLIAISLEFKAKPDPIDPALPNLTAQNAALKHLKAEIYEHYPGSNPKFKLYKN